MPIPHRTLTTDATANRNRRGDISSLDALALAVVVALAGMALAVLFALRRAGRLPTTSRQRKTLITIVVVFIGALIGWVVFVLLAYWD